MGVLMNYLVSVIVVFLLLAGLATLFFNPKNIDGLFGRTANINGAWIDQTGAVAVELYPCAGAICGRVVWVEGDPDQVGADGKKLCGTQVLGGLHRTSGTTWDGGWIYNPLDGGRYSVYIEAVRDRLSVTGYMGSRWFGKTFMWVKAPATLKRCG